MKQPHLRCTREDINPYCLLPGDPGRAERIAKYFDDCKHVSFNREFNIYSGTYKSVPVTVCSTGIGGPSAAIAVHELVNCGAKVLIRVGSCGALQKTQKIGDLIIPEGAVRSEGVSLQYYPREHPALPDGEVLNALIKSAKGYHHKVGFINSHDSFYQEDNEVMEKFWSRVGLLGSDFETAPLFIVAEYLKVSAGSVLNIVSSFESVNASGVESYASGEARAMRGERDSIMVALSAIKKLRDEK